MSVKQEILSYRLITKLSKQELTMPEEKRMSEKTMSEEENKEKSYNQAINLKNKGEYYRAKCLFESIHPYKNSDVFIKACETRLSDKRMLESNLTKEEKKEKNYNQAINLKNKGEYYRAKCLFESVHPYKNSDIFIKACETRLLEKRMPESNLIEEENKEKSYNQAINLKNKGEYHRAKCLFESVHPYKNSDVFIKACETRLKKR